jgi:hypothetical protein
MHSELVLQKGPSDLDDNSIQQLAQRFLGLEAVLVGTSLLHSPVSLVFLLVRVPPVRAGQLLESAQKVRLLLRIHIEHRDALTLFNL